MESNLRFKNGKFRIMLLGDIHEKLRLTTEKDYLRQRDEYNLYTIGVKAYQPDLVVLLGDTCNDYEECDDYITVYKEAIERIIKPIIDANIPVCYCLGNHEHDKCHEKEMVEAMSLIPSFIGVNDESCPGDFNCNLLVKDSKGEKDVLNLWFFDSNNRHEDPTVSYYDWVHEDQIEWYEKKAQEIKDANNGKTIPAIAFQHIPVIEEYELLREAKPYELWNSVKGYIPTLENKNFVLKDGVTGYLGEGPASPALNKGQFKSWKTQGDIFAAFFGHDHLNDFCGEVDGIILGQNKTAGFCVYTDGCRSGFRIIDIEEENPTKIKTEMHHFKDFGLISSSLGPIEKRITDRQSINLHKASYIGAGIAGVTALGAIIKAIKNK